MKTTIMILVGLTLMFCGVIQLDQALQKERHDRMDSYDILEDRIVDLESHFIGHRVVLAKNGRGILIEPCKLNLEKDCHRDDAGISLRDLSISYAHVGIEDQGSGVKTIPHPERKGQLEIANSRIEGVGVDYTGPNDWHYQFHMIIEHILNLLGARETVF